MLNRQRVAHIMPWEGVGGTEQGALRVAHAIREAGLDTVFYCLESAPIVRDFFASAGFETATWLPVLPGFNGYRYFLHESMRLAGEFRRRNIEIVHCADVWAGAYAGLAGRLALAPVICHVRNRYPHIAVPQRHMLDAVNKFVFVSRATWGQFGHAVPPRRGVVVCDGIEGGVPGVDDAMRGEVRREFGVSDDTTLVGMIARVDEAKDYETLAKAARRLIDVGLSVRFLIVGGHSIEQSQVKHFVRVKQWLAANDVTDHFTFTDFRVDVQRLIHGMDIVVLSTHYEGLPLVLLEAMACGKPVVATAVDGVPELVTHNQTGLLFPHADDEVLASHLLTLSQDRDRAERLGTRARSYVETHFSREQFARAIVALYQTLRHRNKVSALIRPRMDRLAELARKASFAAVDATIAASSRR
jgi:glycosyltransferase involved in cell wall biosynthesis